MNTHTLKKILIANRGEIACRIMRSAKQMGLTTVAVYSDADKHAQHVKMADEAYHIGRAPSKDSYLVTDKILQVAKNSGADCIHPGYGFLSENSEFAKACEANNIAFIGPLASSIEAMGSKTRAKEIMAEANVPLVPGYYGDNQDPAFLQSEAEKIGYPVIIKAASGGGGRGMKVCESEDTIETLMKQAGSEAKAAFGDATVYIEKYLGNPRHIEFQVFGDGKGDAIHLGERDCSLQRRHQKVFEEAPSPALNQAQREEIGTIVAKAVKKMGYRGAGTMEFLYEDGNFYFIEMNTRIQVEHPVTEMITGIDLIREQIRVADGKKLSFTQEDVLLVGHAIECRINAEHHETFVPSPGKITDFHAPGGPDVRLDSAVYAGYSIPPHYDSMIAKLIVHGRTRNECIMRLRRALDEMVVGGVDTTLPLHRKLVEAQDVIDGNYDIHWLERFLGLK